ncbi:ribonuclease R [Parvibium lacunae]|uniref:Ribonuclease R n=1 Tax=Parvibium lacunae TaxID=1888893 RepID=A0A368L7K1_9BURK|nr:ribonuclease R [Parvibium lacunae]RCS59596.1 ribonuclease R [Parvibium lacunae]
MPNFDYDIPSREAILALFRQQDTPLPPAQVAELLALPAAHLEGLEKRLDAMERDGQLMRNRKGALLLATRLDFIAGKIAGHRDGYGFLLRDDGGPDVYLGTREMLKVLHGDRVLVKISGTDKRGRPEGTIVEITERRTNKLVGRLLNERNVYVVVPEDQRIKHDILIPPNEIANAQAGQVVMVEILEQPSRYSQPLGRVVEILGAIDDPGMEIEIAVRKFDVPHQFSSAAIKQAEQLPETVQQADLAGRVDLRDIPFVTIDGEDARDFDDAVYCEPILDSVTQEPTGSHRLLVAIADVSHYVQSADAIDQDAVARSTSVYFPRRVIPMLPEKLSNGLCSLNPRVDRLCLVCDMVIGPRGAIKGYQFYPAVIYSHARLTYTEVWGMLSGADLSSLQRYQALFPHLQQLHALFQILVEARNRRGAIDFDTVETYIVCNELGRIEKIIPRVRNDAHRLIEECMLAANVCAADFMARSQHPGLYRIHEGPSPDKLRNLRAFLKTLGINLGGGDSPSPADYASLMRQIEHRPDTSLLQSMLLRSMMQAVYSPDNVGHFGLAYPAYAHFTSPIRRYPDLLTHRVIKALLHGRHYLPAPIAGREEMLPSHPLPPLAEQGTGKTKRDLQREKAQAIWEQYGLLCSANERRADDASRDVQAWLKCFYMKEHVGEQYGGQVTGVAPFGVFVTLKDMFVEGLVHVTELGDEYFHYNEINHELRGERTGQRFRLGDPLNVQVSRVDIEARKIEFRLVKRLTYKQIMAGALLEEQGLPVKKPSQRKKTVASEGPTSSGQQPAQPKKKRISARSMSDPESRHLEPQRATRSKKGAVAAAERKGKSAKVAASSKGSSRRKRR